MSQDRDLRAASADPDQLQGAWEKAEAAAQKIMADKDEAIAKVRDRFGEKLRAANNKAAAAQKAFLDAKAAHALANRDGVSDEEKQRIADSLGLTLPDA